MFTTTSTLAAGLMLLATLTQPAEAQGHGLRWRHAGPGNDAILGSRRWLVTCNDSPVGQRIGTTFSLSNDFAKYCSVDWNLVKDQLGPIYTGGEVSPGVNLPKYCIDATLEPANYVQPHVWTCYSGLYQQNWVYHSSTGHVELGCTGLCLDVKDGYNGPDHAAVVQLYNCIDGNKNQEWDYVAF